MHMVSWNALALPQFIHSFTDLFKVCSDSDILKIHMTYDFLFCKSLFFGSETLIPLFYVWNSELIARDQRILVFYSYYKKEESAFKMYDSSLSIKYRYWLTLFLKLLNLMNLCASTKFRNMKCTSIYFNSNAIRRRAQIES